MNRTSGWISAAFLFGGAICLSTVSSGAQGNDIPGFRPDHTPAELLLEKQFRNIPDASHAESDLRHLTSEPHMAGTEASRRVAEWVRDQYRSFGFEADIVTYTAWMPQPREVKLQLTKPVFTALGSQEKAIVQDKDTLDKRATVGFNAYSPSGDVTAPVVYVNYGTPEDYRELESMGISVQGKIAIVRYGKGYRGVKAQLAELHRAVGLLIYSDPQDDGAEMGDSDPQGPWRPMSGVQRGSILYIQNYAGDPLTPGFGATAGAKRLDPADATNLPHIPTMPINAQDAATILAELGGHGVQPNWQGGLPFTYHTGPSAEVHMKLDMDYEERPLYDVVAKLQGTSDDQWVVLGNHHDAWVFGAADPNSGTAAMLETARALGQLVRQGWKPRRTIVMCHWDGEEFGLLGSTEWVEANMADLQSKAVVYINTDVGVSGPDFASSATPSLREVIRDATRDVEDPNTGRSVYEAWAAHTGHIMRDASVNGRTAGTMDASSKTPVTTLGSGSDFSPFYDHAGIPSIDLGFQGPYGVYHSVYDDFYWMKNFGDPAFAYHATLARVLGTLALRFDEADILPFDYPTYITEIEHRITDVFEACTRQEDQDALEPALDAVAKVSASAHHASVALAAISDSAIDPSRLTQINHILVGVEQAFLAPDGILGHPWYKHTLYAPASDDGYHPEAVPGIREAFDHNDSVALRREAASLTAALLRASARLEEIAQLANEAVPSAPSGH
jgi:N-acetylated-alpha-linked acidic dipeptidase